jgi:hypothetical protein
VRWSVGLEAEGDQILSREEIVGLADAVALSDGIATGIGTNRYGVQLVVEAETEAEAIDQATRTFLAAARTAGLPSAPVVRTEAISKAADDDLDETGADLKDNEAG